MDLNFASFRPICVGKKSTWHAWSMPDGAVSVQVQKHNQHVTVEQWEPRAAVVTSSNFSSCMSQKDKGGNQRSLKTSRRKFMENSEIQCMRKTGKINVWNGVYIYHHLPREEVPTVISQCEKMFHRVLRPAKLWKRTFQIDSWTGSKRVYQRRWWLPSRAIKYWLRRMRASGQQDALLLRFDCKFHIILLFLLAPSSAPRGVPAVPWMWRPWLCSSERGEACVGRFVGNAVVGSKAKFSHVLSSEQFSSNTWCFFLAFNSASIGIAFGGRPKKCLFWPESAASQRSRYHTNIGMLFNDISNLKILMSKDSRGCKQNILKKWLTKALKNRFSLHQKQANKKAFEYPIVYRINAKVWYCWMSWALKRCMIWVSAMLHDPWRMPKETDPWYWYSRLYIISICYILGCTNSCWDRLNSIKLGPGSAWKVAISSMSIHVIFWVRLSVSKIFTETLGIVVTTDWHQLALSPLVDHPPRRWFK